MNDYASEHVAATPAESLELYCPHAPTRKQRLFLDQTGLEVFFGGAAGGGKSVALLMAALQYMHVPGYAALILRKDTQRLALAGGLIPRSHEWLAGKDVKWNAARRQWSFPTAGAPATLTFGYLASPTDKYRYASSEFQFIAFDELTELAEDDYRFLFSRLRRASVIAAPLRMRSASNPGNVGHLWVKQRFIGETVSTAQILAADILPHQGRVFIPSRLADNQHLSADEYRHSLSHLPPVDRERLLSGDWSITEQGLIRAAWLRYYTAAGSQLELYRPDGGRLVEIYPDRCRRFVTVDPAGTSADRMREQRGREPSFTVAQVWEQPRGNHSQLLILRHQVRERVGFDGLCGILRRVHAQWRPERIWIENEKLGQAAMDVLHRELPLALVRTGSRDKATRAGRLVVKLERGEIFLPSHETSWRPGFEAELLAWTGGDNQPTDQIDAAAYAAIVSDSAGPSILKMGPLVIA